MKALLGLFGNVFGAILVLLIVAGGPAVWFYDRAPVGWPDLTIGKKMLFGCCEITLHAPGAGAISAANARGTAAVADYDTERNSFKVMHDAFTVENDAVLSLHTTSARWMATSANAVATAKKANAWRLTLAQQILATPLPADQSELGLCKAAEAELRRTTQ